MCDYCDCRSHPQIAALSADHEVMIELLADLRRAVAVRRRGSGGAHCTAGRAARAAHHLGRARRVRRAAAGRCRRRLRRQVPARARGGAPPARRREETDVFPDAHQLLRPDQWDAVDRVASSLDATLGDLVVANPAAARLLDTLGLDYCCHGDRSLAAACDAAGLDVAARRRHARRPRRRGRHHMGHARRTCAGRAHRRHPSPLPPRGAPAPRGAGRQGRRRARRAAPGAVTTSTGWSPSCAPTSSRT